MNNTNFNILKFFINKIETCEQNKNETKIENISKLIRKINLKMFLVCYFMTFIPFMAVIIIFVDNLHINMSRLVTADNIIYHSIIYTIFFIVTFFFIQFYQQSFMGIFSERD